MPLITDDALVLDSRPYRDRDLIVSLLTGSHGVVRGVLRRARGGKAPRAAAAQILSLVRVSAFQGRHAELATIRELELETSSFAVASDVKRAAAAAVAAELLLTFCPAGDPAPRRYRLGVALLEALVSGVDPTTVVAYAQFWALALGGVLPDIEEAQLRDVDRKFIAECRRRPLAEVTGPPPAETVAWLDRQTRLEAHRSLPALDFFRREGL